VASLLQFAGKRGVFFNFKNLKEEKNGKGQRVCVEDGEG